MAGHSHASAYDFLKREKALKRISPVFVHCDELQGKPRSVPGLARGGRALEVSEEGGREIQAVYMYVMRNLATEEEVGYRWCGVPVSTPVH